MVSHRSSKMVHIPSFDRDQPTSGSHLRHGSDADGIVSDAANQSTTFDEVDDDYATNTAKETASSTRESKVDIYSIEDDAHGYSDSDDELHGVDYNENGNENGNGNGTDHGHNTSSGRWDRIRLDHFIGREDELERLKSIYARLCRKPSKTADASSAGKGKGNKEPQVVLIHGYSGTGKSALVNHFLEGLGVEAAPLSIAPSTTSTGGSDVAAQEKGNKSKRQADMHPCHVGKGKYDQFNNAGNLSAIVDALSSFFEHLGEAGEPDDILEISRIRESIRSKVDDVQRGRMCKIIPGLSNVLAEGCQNSLQINAGDEDMVGRQEQMKMVSKPSRMMNRNKQTVDLEATDDAAPSIDEQSVSAKSMTTESLYDTDQRRGVGSREKEWPRLVYGFKVILKAICTDSRPLVLYLDDLQWVDERSLKLITEILLDPSIRNVLIIGSYRSNEVHNDPQHQLTTAVSQWKSSGKAIHDIPLNDLTVDQTAELLASSLRLDTIKTTPLANLLHDKTKGNVLYTMQALEELRRRNVLTRNIHTLQWEWNEQRAADEIDLSANVVDLITSKLHSLPEDLQKCLQMASFLRSTFRQSLLETLMHWEMEERQMNQADGGGPTQTLSVVEMSVGDALNLAVKEELLERLHTDPDAGPAERTANAGATFRFVHDRIQQAVFSLTPPGDGLDQMKYRVGKYLMEIASDPMLGEDWMWFMAADHLEQVSSLTVSDSIIPTIDYVKLNLKAGQLAAGVAAFVPAAKYLNQALTNLEIKIADPWETQYELCREVYHHLSETELTLGNYDKGSMLCQTIVERSDQFMEDKILVNLSLVKALNRLERCHEALDLQLESLKLLKTFPVRNHLFLAIVEYRKLKKYFANHTDEEVLNLPHMSDPKIKLTMEILHQANYSAYGANKLATFIFVIFRQVRLMLKYGLIAEGAHAMSTTAVILLGKLKEIDLGKRLRALSGSIIDTIESKHVFGNYIITAGAMIDAWSEPIHVCFTDLRRGQQDGMETGDLEAAYRCWAACLLLAFVAGLPLAPLYRAGKTLIVQTQHYGLKAVEDHIAPTYAVWVILIGKHDPTTLFTQDNWRQFADSMSSKRAEPGAWIKDMFAYLASLQLATYFGDLDVGKKCIAPLQSLCKSANTMVVLSVEVFHCGLTMSRLAQRIANNRRKQKKYYRQSKQHIQTMKRYIEEKGGNSLHRYMIMQADAMAASQKASEEAVKAAYDKAISFSARSGYIHETALANELVAEYFLMKASPSKAFDARGSISRTHSHGSSPGNPSEAMYENGSIADHDTESYWPRQYLGNAISLYNEWGARAKVEQMLAKYPNFLDRSMLEGGTDSGDGETNGQRRKRRPAKHTADTRMCLTTAHTVMAKVDLDAL